MNGREVVLGVCGGIAAYKTAMLASKLVQRGAGVTVVMTASAEKFIGRATFAALTGRPVVTDAIDPEHSPLGPHIDLAERGEVLCIAPATANFLASAAHGAAGDALTTLYLAFTGPVLVAPAMNAAMWEKAAVQRNVQQLRDDGVTIIGPGEGWQSCRRSGAGRMSEPEEILAAIEQALGERGA
jgi:phosphopantothenoylcysteine decarboxylase